MISVEFRQDYEAEPFVKDELTYYVATFADSRDPNRFGYEIEDIGSGAGYFSRQQARTAALAALGAHEDFK